MCGAGDTVGPADRVELVDDTRDGNLASSGARQTPTHKANVRGIFVTCSFDTVFSPAGEPATLHFRVVFKAHGADHQLEVWRDGEQRVKRITDQALVTYAVRKPGDADFQLQILDLNKRISTHVDRTTMLRLGQFHQLVRPHPRAAPAGGRLSTRA